MDGIVSLKDSIENLKDNNSKELGSIKKSSEETSDGIGVIKTLSESFVAGLTTLNRNLYSFFIGEKRDNLKELEEKREADRKVTRETDSKSTVPEKDKSSFGDLFIFGGGIVGRLAAILVAIPIAFKEFFVGIGQSVKAMFQTVDNIFNNRLSRFSGSLVKGISNLFRPITNFFDAIGDAFKKAGTGQFVRNNQALGKLIKPLTDFFISLKKFFSIISTSLSKIGTIFKPLTDLFKGFGEIIPTGFIKKFTENTGKFSSAIGKIGKFFRLIGRIFLPVVLFFDGLFGFFRGFSEQTGIVNKIIGGIIGIVQGIVGGFASFFDVLKDILGWVFRLIGLDFISNLLDKFSFRELSDGLFGGLIKAVIFIKDQIVDFFMLPMKILQLVGDGVGFLIDVFKDVGSAIFNFFSFPIRLVQSVIGVISTIIESLKSGASIKETFAAAVEKIKQSIQNLFLSLLPEPDSFLGKFVPAFVYKALGATKGEPRVQGDETSEEDVRDTQTREERLRGLATEMGIDPNEIDATMVGGVPVEINQQEVPVNKYTEKEIKAILAANAVAKALGKEGLPEEKVEELMKQADPNRDIRPGPNARRFVRDAAGNFMEVDIPEEERRQPSVVRIFPDDGPMITRVSDPEQDSLKEKILGSGSSIMSSIASKYFGTLDAIKNGFAKGLEFIGADDLAEKLRGFSIKEKMMEVFNAIGDTITSAFDGLGDIGADILSGIKRIIRGALPAQDSIVGKLIPDFVWEWLGEEKPQPPQRETEMDGESSRNTIPFEQLVMTEDEQRRLDERTAAKRQLQEEFGDSQREPEVPQQVAAAILAARSVLVERTRPERPEIPQRVLSRNILDSSQRQRESGKTSAIAVSSVDTSQRVVNNVNNNTAALMSKNINPVDNLDRSWTGGTGWGR